MFDLRLDNFLHRREGSFTVSLGETKNRVNVNSFAYAIANYSFGMKQTGNNDDKYEVVIPNYPLKTRKSTLILSQPIKFFGFPEEITDYKDTSFLPQLEFSLSYMLSNISYLGPLREYPQRFYSWSGASLSTVGTRGENAIAGLLAARIENRPIDDKIADWLKKMGLIHSFKLEPVVPGGRDYQVRIKKTQNSAEVLITDVGFGVSQLLPVLVLCYYVPEGSIIILEQPEIHLHPSVQSDLADLLIDVVKTRNVQIIFESHSEHLLRRLQRRMAEEKITPDETALYFCSTGESASQIEELKLDDYGNIRNWPKDFFGDEMADIVAKTEAEMIRQGVDPS